MTAIMMANFVSSGSVNKCERKESRNCMRTDRKQLFGEQEVSRGQSAALALRASVRHEMLRDAWQATDTIRGLAVPSACATMQSAEVA